MLLLRLTIPSRLIGWPKRFFVKSSLPTPAQFRRVLLRERVRTDRTGRPFSLVTFAARENKTAEATFRKLENILKRRLRCSDEIGWLDGHHLAAVLPDTPSEGAAKVADDVCIEFSLDWLPPLCETFCYPSDWPSDQRDTRAGEAAAFMPLPSRREASQSRIASVGAGSGRRA
jgi:hypothetical protein